jgi:hypothetical protein
MIEPVTGSMNSSFSASRVPGTPAEWSIGVPVWTTRYS